jgi:predicted lipoprotein with Yx(FWY)xxD motif
VRIFILAAGLALAHSASVGATDTVRRSCTSQRCVLYSQSGKRLGTVQQDDTGRSVIRGNDYKVRAKVTEQDDGRYRIERTRR